MKLFFRYLLLLLIIATLVIITNCNRKTGNENTIRFWHFWSEPYQKAVLDSIINIFEEQNNCSVEVTELSWNDGKTKLMAAFNSNTAPDVLELGSDWVAQFSSAGVLAELNKDSIEFEKFIEFAKAPCYWNNQIYALPWIVDTRVLFVNNDLLKKVGLKTQCPSSFEEILSQANQINSINGAYLFGANTSDAHRLYKKLLTFFWTFGGDILDSSGNFVINSPQNISALDFYVQLCQNGYLETQRQIDAAFSQGKIAYWISGGWLIEKIQNENPKLDYQVCLIPSMRGRKGISFAGGEYLAINVKSKKQELAIKFLKFMTDGTNSIEFCKRINEAGFPADRNYYKDPYFLANPKKMLFANQLEYSKMTPVHPKWLDIEEIIEFAATKVIYSEMDSQTALNMAQEKALQLK